eukprot:m.268338 g.268338  ORF g.268338 m.268338 type:complete len:196 (-) comp19293_c0_seq1:70-657(-)
MPCACRTSARRKGPKRLKTWQEALRGFNQALTLAASPSYIRADFDAGDGFTIASRLAATLSDCGFCAFPGQRDWPSKIGICTGVDNMLRLNDVDIASLVPSEREAGLRRLYVPNNLIVTHHATKKQLNTAINKLFAWLAPALKDTEVVAVTLCRSIRDGYFPRKHFDFVETAVVKGIKAMLPSAIVVSNGARSNW